MDAATVALVVTDHADNVRASRSIGVCSKRMVANTGLKNPTLVTRPN